MSSVERRFPKEEFSRRGDQLYDALVRPQMASEDKDKFVALDIETGDFELHEDELKAVDLLRQRLPKAQVWLVRVGSEYLHRIGVGRVLET